MVKKPWTETAMTVAMNVVSLGGDRWLIWMAGGVFCLNIVLWGEWWRGRTYGVPACETPPSDDVKRARLIAEKAQQFDKDTFHLGHMIYLNDLVWALKVLAASGVGGTAK